MKGLSIKFIRSLVKSPLLVSLSITISPLSMRWRKKLKIMSRIRDRGRAIDLLLGKKDLEKQTVMSI